MKKLVLVALAVVLMASSAFAKAEMKVKVGLETGGTISDSYGSNDMDMGFGVAGELLFPVGSMIKVGPGIGVSIANISQDFYMKYFGITETLTSIPIYATVEVTPIKAVPGIFFKGNLGLNIGSLSVSGPSGLVGSSSSGAGLYYGIAAGYDFPFGLFLEAMYSGNGAAESGGGTLTYSKVTLSAGYKFKL